MEKEERKKKRQNEDKKSVDLKKKNVIFRSMWRACT